MDGEQTRGIGEVVCPGNAMAAMAISASASMTAAACADAEDEETEEELMAQPAAPAELRDDASSANTWGRLVALTQGLPSIELTEQDLRLGRSDAKGDKRVSKVHCRIWREESGAPLIRDQSVNGTLLRGVRLERDKPASLQHGDVVVLGPSAPGFPVYVYQAEKMDGEGAGAGAGQQTRKRERQEETGSLQGKKIKLVDFTDTLKCSICWNLWHDTVSVAPCLHSFCNSCFSDWYRRSNSYNSACKCPQCRVPVVSVGRNHTLCNLMEEMLRENPLLRRPQADIDKMDKNALVKSDIMRLTDPERPISSTDAFVHSDGDTQSEDVEASTCRQCEDHAQESVLPATASTFRCGASTIHISCSACFSLMPFRPELEVPQKCVACQLVYCDAYFRSENFPARPGLDAGCPLLATLKPVNQWVVADVPAHTHRGNDVEKEITRRYLLEHHITVQDLIADWLLKLEAGDADLPRFSTGPPPASFTSISPVCNKCEDVLVDHVLYRFRRTIPRHDLPSEAAAREDCWYGYSCFTQFNSPEHARRYNHVCEAQPGRTVRTGPPRRVPRNNVALN